MKRLHILVKSRRIFCYAWIVGALAGQTIRITGSIPRAGRVELVGAGSSPPGASSGRSVRVSIPNEEGGVRPVVLSLRTNCSYFLTAEWLGPAGTSAKVLGGAMSPAAGTGHLRPGALEAIFTGAELPPGSPAVCLRGTAVSRGGNDTTSDNAVLVEMRLDLPREVPNGAVLFTLNLAN